MNAQPVLAAWRPPFASGSVEQFRFDASDTIGAMVDGCTALKPWAFRQNGRVMLHGRDGRAHEIAREHWDRVRLREGQTITLHVNLQGGGGQNSDKSGLGTAVAIIAFVAATIVTGGAAAPLLGSFFAAGQLGAQLLATGILLAGSLAAAALTGPPVQSDKNKAEPEASAASVDGNVLSRGAFIPRVIGTRLIYPPFMCQPLVYRDGDDEWVEAIVGLAGPHQLDDIRFGDTPIDGASNIQYEIREGWDDDLPVSLITRYAKVETPQAEMRAHDLDENSESGKKLADQVDPSASLPQWIRFRAIECDEVRFEMSLPSGLWNQANANQVQGVALRVRIRAQGDTDWINLPELHLANNKPKEVRQTLVLKWADEALPRRNPAKKAGWVAAYNSVPAPDNGLTDGWDADAMFSGSTAGSSSYRYGFAGDGLTDVRRVSLSQSEAIIYLDSGTIAPGPVEIEVKRSMTYSFTNAEMADYQLAGGATVYDPFGYVITSGEAEVFRAISGVSDQLYILRQSAIRNDHPINGGQQGSRLALIAIRAKNRALGKISVQASGYVRDWTGTAWSNWTTTSNPAPHYRDVLTGRESGDAMPESLIDDDKLVAWRTQCVSGGYTCDMVCEGAGVSEVINFLASCGYARPWASEKYGVIRDYDRSAESPVQIFGPRNANSLSMSKAFARLPDAFRVKYRNADDDDREAEIIVYRPDKGQVADPRFEEVNYVGITAEAPAIARAEFDLNQAKYRSAFWSWNSPAEALVCQRGDLVGLNHWVIQRQQASARIAGLEFDGTDLVAVILDAPVQCWNEPDFTEVADVTLVADVIDVGRQTGIAIRQSDGSLVTKALAGSSGSRSVLEFTTAFTPDNDSDGFPKIRDGNLVTIGDLGSEYRRLIVIGIQPKDGMAFSITAAAEAPQLWAA
ncbi:hypothetical protein CSC94_05860 [Zhengella mangrovi]|uniref:Tip attachment protein J domain-containing protein n=1 Tax=Zhengella mangrovi TaxID=1982044 RepID=A0A2G1QRP2_9HYPH|nr:hypothetical protein [Zhengella mangrovi]PHP68175.1 hypothetical protein CSC94_05860 [Zhengella mangrovi]